MLLVQYLQVSLSERMYLQLLMRNIALPLVAANHNLLLIPYEERLACFARQEVVVVAVNCTSLGHKIRVVLLRWNQRVWVVDQAGCVGAALVRVRQRKSVDRAVYLPSI